MDNMIKDIPKNLHAEAVEIFANAFLDDPLYLFAFPDVENRRRLTKIMYEFVVYDMVPTLNLNLRGAFVENKLLGCMIYTTPESNVWNDKLYDAIERMRKKANDGRMNLIGEFARLSGYDPGVKYLYGNELAVRKEYRKMGLGKSLCYYLIEECKNHPSAKGILIDTANEGNVYLYEKWGWELKNTVSFYTIKKYFMWRDK